MRQITTLVLYIMFLAPTAFGQEQVVYGLEQCLKRALEVGPQLELAKNEIKAAQVFKSKISRSRFLPKFDLENISSIAPAVDLGPSGFADDATKNDWGDIGPFNRVKISMIQPVFTFGKLKNALKATDALLQLKQEGLEYKKREITSLVTQLYYTRVFIKEANRLIKEGHNSISKAIKHLKKRRKKKGKFKDSDLFQLEMFAIALNNRELEVIDLNKKTIESLKKLLGIDNKTQFDTEDDFLDPVEDDVLKEEEYLAKIGKEHLLLSQLNHAITAKNSQLSIEKSNYFPQFFLAGQLEYATAPNRQNTTNPFLNDPFNRTQAGLVFGFKMPLSFHLTSINVQQKEVELEKLQIQKSLAEIMLELKIKEAHQKVSSAQKTMDNNENLRIVAKKWLNSEMITFDLGGKNGEDLLKALKAYLESSATFFESVLSFNQKFAQLELASSTVDNAPISASE